MAHLARCPDHLADYGAGDLSGRRRSGGAANLVINGDFQVNQRGFAEAP